MIEYLNLARIIFCDRIEAFREEIENHDIELDVAIDELSLAISYCDAFYNLDSIDVSDLAKILLTE